MFSSVIVLALLGVAVDGQVRTSFSSPYASYSTEYDSLGYQYNPREYGHHRHYGRLHRHLDDRQYHYGSDQVYNRQYPYYQYPRRLSHSSSYRQGTGSVYLGRQVPFARTASISNERDYYPVTTRDSTYERYAPQPYSFDYAVNGVDGSQERQENGDGSGRVNGAYSFALPDGRRRVVQYTADEGGFRAKVDTNEAGTESQNPAAIQLYSSAVPGSQAAILSDRNYQY